MDDSVNSQHALEWLECSLLKDGDEVHIAVVALPVPYPVSFSPEAYPLRLWNPWAGCVLDPQPAFVGCTHKRACSAGWHSDVVAHCPAVLCCVLHAAALFCCCDNTLADS